jgi:hypothetical protein
MSVKLFGERFDDDHAQAVSGLTHIQVALPYPHPIVGNRKSPAHFSRLIGDDKLTSGPLADKGMLERIDHKLRDNETDAYRLGGRSRAAPHLDLQRDRTIVIRHRGYQGLAQSRDIGANLDRLALA